jgi:DNA modification methylase
MMPTFQIITGDALQVLRTLPDESIDCCVTSPPYWGLRDYGVAGQMGLETSPKEFLEKMSAVFSEVRRALKARGTCWVNMGDTYASAWVCNRRSVVGAESLEHGKRADRPNRLVDGLKEKDMCGMPWRLAFALQDSGWYLRSDIIWHKANCLPESVSDRPTKSHEYIFLLTKAPKYFYDAEAIMEPCSENTHARVSQDVAAQIGSQRANGGGKTNGNMKAVVRGGVNPKAKVNATGSRQNESFANGTCLEVHQRNKRTVWTVPAAGYKGAHFATFPPDLIKPCILAGCPVGGTVLDPFTGSGTTGEVAIGYGRNFVGIELNPEYVKLANDRIAKAQPGFALNVEGSNRETIEQAAEQSPDLFTLPNAVEHETERVK